MNLFDKLLVFSCVIVYVSAAALSDDLYQGDLIIDDDAINPDKIVEDPDPAVERPRRFSCDLFSFETKWGSSKHAVCAFRCLSKGKKGGVCENGVCHCRGSWLGK